MERLTSNDEVKKYVDGMSNVEIKLWLRALNNLKNRNRKQEFVDWININFKENPEVKWVRAIFWDGHFKLQSTEELTPTSDNDWMDLDRMCYDDVNISIFGVLSKNYSKLIYEPGFKSITDTTRRTL